MLMSGTGLVGCYPLYVLSASVLLLPGHMSTHPTGLPSFLFLFSRGPIQAVSEGNMQEDRGLQGI